MASLAKTVVATGITSGLGFEAAQQLLTQESPYRIILGARDVAETEAAFDKIPYDRSANSVTVLPLELLDLKNVEKFSRLVIDKVGVSKIDYLMINAAMITAADGPGPHGSSWCHAAVVNHFAQHYLVHLLREKLVSSQTRIVFVSSGAIRNVPDPRTLTKDLAANSGAETWHIYSGSKFVQLLGAHWWRRQLAGQCRVVAVSPGLIPNTGLGRSTGMNLTMDMPDAKTVPEGARSILAAFFRDDFPSDPERIFLTSWGEWWEKSVYEKTLDKDLQDQWCPSKDAMEKEARSLT
ncbi:hypothetical protein DCS_06055 [Drechmeria coniospora]|uniref:Short-chain dehydrogenase/reductase SDR n=1 Tax=Drechmeria coniospora TaxID=98403 RepID=A0A151GAH9_DRECN|nr:hypothetical protein DCS_06055 [Drechmeria coniospora]KYK54099.1 hypothetical protein DCS_06055 [Drechmeria coniospora]